MREAWLNLSFDDELQGELTRSQEWINQVSHPRLRIYETGRMDSDKLQADGVAYGKLHAKFWLEDDIGFVGTDNFDYRSRLYNNEMGYFFESQALGRPARRNGATSQKHELSMGQPGVAGNAPQSCGRWRNDRQIHKIAKNNFQDTQGNRPDLDILKRFRLKVAALAILMIPISSDADFEPHCSGLPAPVLENETIAVVTLNLAHGRGLSFNQMFTTTRKIESNLQQVALLLNRIDADAVALQEADAASKWSGNFDHVQFLKTETGYTCKAHGKHADSWLYNYGTALLARSRFTRVVTHNFEPSPPTTPKGFTMGVVDWNPGGRLSEPVSLRLFSNPPGLFTPVSPRISDCGNLGTTGCYFTPVRADG